MSILAAAKKPELKAPMMTIIGGAGVGKTTLAALFPRPIILQSEEGDSVFDTWADEAKPDVISMAGKKKPYQFIMEFIRELYTTEHEFKTVIVDSNTALNLMLEKQVVAEEIEQGLKTTNIADACGGYHKGYIYVASLHAEIIRGFDALRKEKGITVIFLGHSEIIKIKNNPDDASEYAVFGLSMHQKSANNYINNCDAVLYLTKEKFITGAEISRKTGATTKFGRATESGNRILVTSGDGKTGYISAKNRYDLEPEIAVPHGTNPLLEQIKFFNTQA